ncbi:unnamed protein product [Ectocarpus fasciculatus]
MHCRRTARGVPCHGAHQRGREIQEMANLHLRRTRASPPRTSRSSSTRRADTHTHKTIRPLSCPTQTPTQTIPKGEPPAATARRHKAPPQTNRTPPPRQQNTNDKCMYLPNIAGGLHSVRQPIEPFNSPQV